MVAVGEDVGVAAGTVGVTDGVVCVGAAGGATTGGLGDAVVAVFVSLFLLLME